MKFARCCFPKVTEFLWSTGRQGAAQRRVNRDAEKNALTPELAPYATADDRRARLEATHNPGQWTHMRDFYARSWRKARRMLREAAPDVRQAVLIRWNRGSYPWNGPSLHSVILMHSRNLGHAIPAEWLAIEHDGRTYNGGDVSQQIDAIREKRRRRPVQLDLF